MTKAASRSRQRSVRPCPKLRSANQSRQAAAGELELACANQLQFGRDMDVVIGNEQRPCPLVAVWPYVGEYGRSDYVGAAFRRFALPSLGCPDDFPAQGVAARRDGDDSASDRIL